MTSLLTRISVSGISVAAAALAISGPPPIAVAAPGEWDVGQFDSCIDRVDISYMAGDITDAQHNDLYQQCCRISGGQWTPHGGGLGTCGAPPALAPSTPTQPSVNAPDVPAGPGPSSPTKSKPTIPLVPLPNAPS